MKNNLLELVQNFTGQRQIGTIDIEIPHSLFYCAEGLQNGYEHKLEDEVVTIKCTGEDYRDVFILNIIIKEKEDTSKNVLLKERQTILIGTIDLKLPYQKARKLVLDMIVEGMPYSVNLITR